MWTKVAELGQKVKTKGNDAEVAGAAGSWKLHCSGGNCRSGLVTGPAIPVAERGALGPDLAL